MPDRMTQSAIAEKAAGVDPRRLPSMHRLSTPAPVSEKLKVRPLAASNHRMQQALRSGLLQAKLTVNQPGDIYEQEANHVADQVMRSPEPLSGRQTSSPAISVQRACACGECPECRKKGDTVQRAASGNSTNIASAPSLVHDVLRSPGQPLDATTRSFMEPRFGMDLSSVRVHTDSKASESATAINARAYTVSNDIVFAKGEYAPSGAAGRHLLAHELAHTIQQRGAHSIQRQAAARKVLAAPRFSGDALLDRVLNNETLIQRGSRGASVRLIQESLIAQGYTLPGFGIDGEFGAETEAAVKLFQTDAGAAKIDGIVGPETMGLLDLHDTTNLTGPGPVAKQGPLGGPRPAPAAGCDGPYAGVTFTLAHQVGTGVNPAATIGIGRRGGRDALVMQGTVPANYKPEITINAPSNANAQQFQVGFISNLLTDLNEYVFSTGARIHAVLPTPMKDGVALSSGQYDPVYVTQASPHILETFTGNGATVHLNWPDTPSDLAFVNLLDNPQCGGPLAPGTMTRNRMKDTFRTWVAARHIPSGCVVPLHHIDWNLDWSSSILSLGPFGFVAAVTGSAINVTEPNGDGKPRFIQGGQVPDDFVAAHTDRVCS
jgi:peptidoglycan hydrolase-like protein with peptidoglycan-binding domain